MPFQVIDNLSFRQSRGSIEVTGNVDGEQVVAFLSPMEAASAALDILGWVDPVSLSVVLRQRKQAEETARLVDHEPCPTGHCRSDPVGEAAFQEDSQ